MSLIQGRSGEVHTGGLRITPPLARQNAGVYG